MMKAHLLILFNHSFIAEGRNPSPSTCGRIQTVFSFIYLFVTMGGWRTVGTAVSAGSSS